MGASIEVVPAGAFAGPGHQDETVLQLVLALEDAGAVTPTELQLPAEMEYDAYTGMGRFLGRIKRSSSWWIGDWLIHGEGTMGDKFAQAASETGLDEQTLLHYSFVCKAIAPKERRASLAFSTHALTSRMSVKDRKAWLDKAEKHAWKREDLAAAIKAKRREERPQVPGTEDESNLREVAEAILRDARPSTEETGYHLIPDEDVVRLKAALGYEDDPEHGEGS